MRSLTKIAQLALALFAGGCAAVLLALVVLMLIFGQRTMSFWFYCSQVAAAIAAALGVSWVSRSERVVKSSGVKTILANLPFVMLFLTFVIIQICLFVNLPPPLVFRLEVRQDPVESVEFSMFSSQRVITASNLCADVLQTIRTARAGEMHPSPVLGRLTIHYCNGTNAVVEVLPGHRPNELDLVGHGMVYNISRSQMLAALRRDGLLSE
jgi:hypothetical protein